MWTSAAIAGKVADVFSPESPAKPRFGLLYLHDLGGESLAGSPIFTGLLAQHRFACICPRGGNCWWADKLCAEFDPEQTPEKYILQAVVPFFRQQWELGPRALGIMGIGMGGQGALRVAFKHSDVFPAVAGISSALDHYEHHGRGTALDDMYDSKEQCRQDTALLHMHPTRYPPHIFFCIDPDDRAWYRGNDRLHEKMGALGIPHEVDFSTRAGGHSWNYFHHQADHAIRFLAAALDQESRRLL